MPVIPSLDLRVALGLGDQELEQRLRPALEAAEDLKIVAQCLAADQLLQLVSSQAVDAVVIAWSLHRLTDALLAELDRPGLIVVLLVQDPGEDRWRQRRGPVLSIECDAASVHQAILSARPGLRRTPRPTSPPEPMTLKPIDRAASATGAVIAVAGGAGSPGRTTLAISLAMALGTAAPAALVELDLTAPAVAAYLDLDPSCNVCTLAHAVREDPRAWSAALADELQPLAPNRSHTLVLCGPPKREMRSTVGPALVERLVDELAQRYRWIILDVGPELLGADTLASAHRVALARADQILLVSGADFVGLWHTRTMLDQIERLLGIERRNVQLVLNKHDSRFHHLRAEVEWHLGAPVVAVVPFDQTGLQRAISEQRPVVQNPSSRAARALLSLAEDLQAGKPRLPAADYPGARVHWWQRVLHKRGSATPRRHLVRVDAARPAAITGDRSRSW